MSSSTGDQAGGATRVADRFDLTLDASIAVIEELSFGIGLGGLWQRAAGLADAQVDLDGDGTADLVLEDDSDTHWRNLTNTYLYASYTPVAWLSADLTLYTITGQLDPDGSRRNPFFGPDTMLSLSFAVTIDRLYQSARGRSAGSSASGARLP